MVSDQLSKLGFFAHIGTEGASVAIHFRKPASFNATYLVIIYDTFKYHFLDLT